MKQPFVQESDMFAPSLRKDGDMYAFDSYLLSVNYLTDYNSHQVMTLQARTSVKNEEVSTLQVVCSKIVCLS